MDFFSILSPFGWTMSIGGFLILTLAIIGIVLASKLKQYTPQPTKKRKIFAGIFIPLLSLGMSSGVIYNSNNINNLTYIFLLSLCLILIFLLILDISLAAELKKYKNASNKSVPSSLQKYYSSSSDGSSSFDYDKYN